MPTEAVLFLSLFGFAVAGYFAGVHAERWRAFKKGTDSAAEAVEIVAVVHQAVRELGETPKDGGAFPEGCPMVRPGPTDACPFSKFARKIVCIVNGRCDPCWAPGCPHTELCLAEGVAAIHCVGCGREIATAVIGEVWYTENETGGPYLCSDCRPDKGGDGVQLEEGTGA